MAQPRQRALGTQQQPGQSAVPKAGSAPPAALTRLEPQRAGQRVGVRQVGRDSARGGHGGHRLAKAGGAGRHAQRGHKVHPALSEVRACTASRRANLEH
jgi:hypothetical protein